MALEVKDKNGNQIKIHDKVCVLVNPGLDLGPDLINKVEVFAAVIEILTETELKCMPLKEGLPFKTSPENVTVVSSLVEEILEATKDKDFNQIMADAESRLELFSKAKSSKRGKGKGSGTSTKVNLASELELD